MSSARWQTPTSSARHGDERAVERGRGVAVERLAAAADTRP